MLQYIRRYFKVTASVCKQAEEQAALTAADSLTGTPLYLSPEAIEHPDSVDVRSDLYAVGYYLLTGSPVFNGNSVVEICMQQVNATPVSPSERLGQSISEDLQTALLACLEKDPDQRPQTARDLLKILRSCSASGNWSEDDAENWWNAHGGIQVSFTEQFGSQKKTSHLDKATLLVSQPPAESESFDE